MKKIIMFAMVVLCATGVMAQRAKKSSKSAEIPEGQVIKIKEISGVGGDSDYLAEPPQINEKGKVKINHTDDYKKDNVKGWHFFEVAYNVGAVGTDASGKKKPILVIPEVEVTFAVLYDMKKSKLASSVANNAKKAGGAIGWENAKQEFSLFTKTITYTSITPKREHYAAVCVPPSAIAAYGDPVAFSVQISVDGVPQGDVETSFSDTKVGTKMLKDLVTEKGKNCAWWESIENKTESVVRREGILRDRSMTPFVMAGDRYYDQVKMDK